MDAATRARMLGGCMLLPTPIDARRDDNTIAVGTIDVAGGSEPFPITINCVLAASAAAKATRSEPLITVSSTLA